MFVIIMREIFVFNNLTEIKVSQTIYLLLKSSFFAALNKSNLDNFSKKLHLD